MPITGEGYVIKHTPAQTSKRLHECLRIRGPRNVIVKERAVSGVTKSGIHVAYDERLQKVFGIVLMVGELVDEVKPLDRVWYHRYAGDLFTFDEEELHVMSANDLMAVIEDIEPGKLSELLNV